MAAHRPRSSALARLRVRLADAEATLRAIRRGEVDAVVVAGDAGPQVFTLQGSEHAYRALIETMNEGALTLAADKVILYANQCFARMVKCPLEDVIGSSFRRFLSAEDRATLRPLLRRPTEAGSKSPVLLNARDGSKVPAQVSIRPLSRTGPNRATTGMVVTDLTEARRTENLLRALTHRVVQVQETERSHVALELHDKITQNLCAILYRYQALAGKLPARDQASRTEAMKLRKMLGETATEVERISRDLRPGALDHMGLVAVLRKSGTEFAGRTGVAVRVVGGRLDGRLTADSELTLYRIFQEALRNVERHARARRVTVCLTQKEAFIQLVINDDGIGFDTDHRTRGRKRMGGLGLLGMRERAAHAGGSVTIESGRIGGTNVEVRIPLAPRAAAGG